MRPAAFQLIRQRPLASRGRGHWRLSERSRSVSTADAARRRPRRAAVKIVRSATVRHALHGPDGGAGREDEDHCAGAPSRQSVRQRRSASPASSARHSSIVAGVAPADRDQRQQRRPMRRAAGPSAATIGHPSAGGREAPKSAARAPSAGKPSMLRPGRQVGGGHGDQHRQGGLHAGHRGVAQRGRPRDREALAQARRCQQAAQRCAARADEVVRCVHGVSPAHGGDAGPRSARTRAARPAHPARRRRPATRIRWHSAACGSMPRCVDRRGSGWTTFTRRSTACGRRSISARSTRISSRRTRLEPSRPTAAARSLCEMPLPSSCRCISGAQVASAQTDRRQPGIERLSPAPRQAHQADTDALVRVEGAFVLHGKHSIKII